ncbi:MAG: hypothetical protein AAB388_01100 [Patescibacteria group bacterium]
MPIVLAIVAVLAVVGIGAFLVSTNNGANGTPEVATTTVPQEEVASSPQDQTPTPDQDPIATEPSTDESPVVTPTPPTPKPVAVPAQPPVEEDGGTSGTFSAISHYLTPDRTDHEIEVTLTLVDGVVTDSDVVYDNIAGYTTANQERFDKVYQTEVIGKSLDEINLSQVGGASITSRTFNEAVAKIKAQT